MKVPIVSIVGRPNVGKSTIFNRIAGKRIAITADEPGTTRDRVFHRVDHPAMDFFLVDTGGIQSGQTMGTIEGDIQAQTHVALQDSDLILFVVDAREDLNKDDIHAADLLRRKAGKKAVLLVANKCDTATDQMRLASLYKLGMGDPFPVSGMHGTGCDELVEEAVKRLKGRDFLTKDNPEYKREAEFEAKHLSIALVGKPNVGKSSLVNALLNVDKLIVSDIPGTTRDSVDTMINHNQKIYNLIDTAGLRRTKNVETGIEYFSVMRTLSAIERADVVVLMLDSHEKVTDQDQQIANVILKSNKGCIIMANKWDIILNAKMTEEVRQSTYIGYLQKKFGFMPWAPVVFASTKTRKNLTSIFGIAENIKAERQKRIPTSQLNHCIDEAMQAHGPTGTKRFAPKLFYTTQVDVNPPRFVFFVNKKGNFHFSYARYLERKLRDKFGFVGTPIVLEYNEKEKRFAKKKR
jgi:GTPase